MSRWQPYIIAIAIAIVFYRAIAFLPLGAAHQQSCYRVPRLHQSYKLPHLIVDVVSAPYTFSELIIVIANLLFFLSFSIGGEGPENQ